jgi:hypothetical protein
MNLLVFSAQVQHGGVWRGLLRVTGLRGDFNRSCLPNTRVARRDDLAHLSDMLGTFKCLFDSYDFYIEFVWNLDPMKKN